MKGFEAITTGTIGIVLIIGTTSFLLISIPKMVEEIVEEISYASAAAVAKDLAGFITVSAAAPYKVDITFKPSEKFNYKGKIKNRFVTMEISYSGIEMIKEKLKGNERIAVDPTTSFQNVNTFIISKERKGLKNYYSVETK